jgi:hypothetical protein
MKHLLLTSIVAAFLVAGHSRLEAGQVTTTPPYTQPNGASQPFVTYVAPNSDGTFTITYKATSGDPHFSASGTFAGASSFNGPFPGSGSTLTQAVIYPSTSTSGPYTVTILIVTGVSSSSDCTDQTSFVAPHYSNNRYFPFGSCSIALLSTKFASMVESAFFGADWHLPSVSAVFGGTSNTVHKEVHQFSIQIVNRNNVDKK